MPIEWEKAERRAPAPALPGTVAGLVEFIENASRAKASTGTSSAFDTAGDELDIDAPFKRTLTNDTDPFGVIMLGEAKKKLAALITRRMEEIGVEDADAAARFRALEQELGDSAIDELRISAREGFSKASIERMQELVRLRQLEKKYA